jgi:hypothetical protein
MKEEKIKRNWILSRPNFYRYVSVGEVDEAVVQVKAQSNLIALSYTPSLNVMKRPSSYLVVILALHVVVASDARNGHHPYLANKEG